MIARTIQKAPAMKALYHVCYQIGRRYWIFEKYGRHEKMYGPLTKGGEDDYNDFLEGRRNALLADQQVGG